MTLEGRLARVEHIVAALERDSLELDQALALFEEGIGHVRAAQDVLRQGELRVETLLEDGAGGVILEPMELGGE